MIRIARLTKAWPARPRKSTSWLGLAPGPETPYASRVWLWLGVEIARPSPRRSDRLDHVLELWHIISHLDSHLASWAASMGPWVYVLLFAIIFCETGLVVLPILPGDTLLFAVGAMCPTHVLEFGVVVPLLLVAAVIGDAVNYSVGRAVGPKVFTSQTSRLLNREHLLRTQAFYERYGGKTIIIARFIPIVRTFAPFVAGVGKMQYRRFLSFNLVGAVAWIVLATGAGYLFGNIEFVHKHFELVVLAIVALSLLPAVVEYARERGRMQRAKATG
jgi:membrane-associated protein